jgi:UDP-N-acetylmuramate: L-alanyl-gamma-D-glutamyl-meso-diaminopimelate ligase
MGRFFLLEGDEYPSSNTDNQSKFLHYRPAHVLLAPLAHDHVNVFPTIESYLAPFHQLFDLVPRDGSSLWRPQANSASDFSPKRNAMS